MTDKRNISKVLELLEPFRWKTIQPEAYKEDGSNFKGVGRTSLIGTRSESTSFHLRYFEIAPDGYTTYERHHHEHVVFVLRGRGVYRSETQRQSVKHGDVVYISPNDPHQFRNESTEPFGFLCIVDAKRDKPFALEQGDESSCFGPEVEEAFKKAEKE